ncbi:DUF551 domain-containing protein [Acinetobacter guillouiae]|uniref:DUF551 domain-containing protein n=1 Tax=Acinetobacter TaxID=469 RepID=UPI002487D657|nr:DUF551 domain-containing protein [Acinetobacter sp.]MDI1222941.1 DUF551 domain-containing protein [Acinetobacter sp.]
MNWISVENKRPVYGQPILIVVDGVTQNITYMLDGSDDSSDWCEPYFFEHDDCCKMWWDKVTHWMPLPEPPKEEKEEG